MVDNAGVGGYGQTIIAVMWVQTIIALIFVCMRLYTRFGINHVAGWDDYLILLSWFMLMPYTAFCTAAAVRGFGRHASQLQPSQFVQATKLEIIGQTFCIIGIATSKASVCVFLLRITIRRWHQYVLYFTIFQVSVICFFCALFDFVRCDPIAHVWNPTIPAHCFISDARFTILSQCVGVSSTVSDFILAVLPWFILWNLKMSSKEKILIACSMSLGIIAMICGIVRAIVLQNLNARSDYSYETVGLILWSSTELMITILAATIPTLRPLYKKLLNHTLSSRETNQASHSNRDNFQRFNNNSRKIKVKNDTLVTVEEREGGRNMINAMGMELEEGMGSHGQVGVGKETFDGKESLGDERSDRTILNRRGSPPSSGSRR